MQKVVSHQPACFPGCESASTPETLSLQVLVYTSTPPPVPPSQSISLETKALDPDSDRQQVVACANFAALLSKLKIVYGKS